jgi:hypothetical protein
MRFFKSEKKVVNRGYKNSWNKRGLVFWGLWTAVVMMAGRQWTWVRVSAGAALDCQDWD